MFQYSNSKTVEHNIDKVLGVILDIENYPKFLPWCGGARIISKSNDQITADLIISFKAINVKYTSLVTIKNTLNDNDVIFVTSNMIEGPFKFLNSRWKLTKIDEGKTYIEFDIEFSFQSVLLKTLITPVFSNASSKILNSFEGYLDLC
jgi:coenzyme Q-binding protein COQ10